MIIIGIFDKLTGKTATLNPKSALVLSAITVIAADGIIDQAEMNDLAKICRGDRKSIDTAMEVLKANKFPGVIDMIANVLDEKQKIATLAILCDLAMSDGVLAGEEKAILQMYMNKFGIPEATMTPIIEAIAIKNDFSIFA
ncbi:MAG: tellurite resistance TerB family protein [Methanoregula sp.]|nr:tellurite resistance TerB family protein [Methanoregula sp.]